MRERRTATPSSEVAFWALVCALFVAVVHGFCAPAFEHDVGLPVIDLDGASSPERTLALMAQYGPAGRQRYLAFLSLDCLLPVAGSLLLLALYEAVTRGARLAHVVRRSLVTIGVLPAVADLVENTLYALLAACYPRHAEPLAALAYGATLVKLASGSVSVLLLALLLGRWARRRAPTAVPPREGVG